MAESLKCNKCLNPTNTIRKAWSSSCMNSRNKKRILSLKEIKSNFSTLKNRKDPNSWMS
jgi:hypothetical protein